MSTAPRLAAPLSKGDRIGVVTVSAPEPAADPAIFDRGIAALAARGFEPVLGTHVSSRAGYRAGTSAELLDDFHSMIADETIAGVVFAGGGKSANRLLSGLDFPLIAAHPKAIVGVSDPSLILNAITAHTGLVTFHGPSVMWDWAQNGPAETAEHFTALLSGRPSAARIDAPLTWTRAGAAEGDLVAGCLSSLRCLLGTPWEPVWDGALLVIEDAFKSTEVLDQALTHFRDCGVLDRIAGLIVGEPVGCEPTAGITVADMVDEVCQDYAWPLAHGLPYGHTPLKVTLPIGASARMDADAEHPLTITSPWTADRKETR
ncbi:LD-carboxypeptidase [Streptomyces sp. DK15]|uniref:S66 peptidase family protein n=1 Tax=Streptomyces sp. DK15 TaxID=2957499 RepID=UPI0029B2DEAD|nr:LD-carboxypeptidase [Streptomyces sp. DK15]MDX2394102.1 LD-carboxypeptidase [Streptomyces sp. DK15]